MNLKRIFIFSFVALLLIMESSMLIAKESYSNFTGTVVGIRLRKWLEVESGKDKGIVNFRIGRSTRYIPHRYPNVGEKVKVEYLMRRGDRVAYTVTILEGSKKSPKER